MRHNPIVKGLNHGYIVWWQVELRPRWPRGWGTHWPWGRVFPEKRTLSSSRDTRSSTLLSPASNCCFLLAGGHRSSTAFGCSLLRLTPSMTCRRSVYIASRRHGSLQERPVCQCVQSASGLEIHRPGTAAAAPKLQVWPLALAEEIVPGAWPAIGLPASSGLKGNLNINQVDAIYGCTLHGIIHHHTWQQKSLLVACRFGESDVNRANSSRLICIIPYSIGGPRGLLSTREPKESHWPAFICTLSHVHWET